MASPIPQGASSSSNILSGNDPEKRKGSFSGATNVNNSMSEMQTRLTTGTWELKEIDGRKPQVGFNPKFELDERDDPARKGKFLAHGELNGVETTCNFDYIKAKDGEQYDSIGNGTSTSFMQMFHNTTKEAIKDQKTVLKVFERSNIEVCTDKHLILNKPETKSITALLFTTTEKGHRLVFVKIKDS